MKYKHATKLAITNAQHQLYVARARLALQVEPVKTGNAERLHAQSVYTWRMSLLTYAG
jgi:hypothetical protein